MKRIAFAALLVILVSVACGSTTPKPTTTPQEDAWYACTMFVERQLRVSSRDAQRYNSAGVKDLSSGQYEVTVYYAQQAKLYKCGLLHRANGDWQLLFLGLDVPK